MEKDAANAKQNAKHFQQHLHPSKVSFHLAPVNLKADQYLAI